MKASQILSEAYLRLLLLEQAIFSTFQCIFQKKNSIQYFFIEQYNRYHIFINLLEQMRKKQSSIQSFDQYTGRSIESGGWNQGEQFRSNGFSKKQFGFITIIIILAVAWGYSQSPNIIYENKQFNYHVYCPIFEEVKHLQRKTHIGILNNIAQFFGINYGYREILNQYKDELNHTYLVKMRAMQGLMEEDADRSKAQIRLKFCGYARPWYGTCKDAQFVCSNPGPVFDVNQNQAINVIWVNQIDFSQGNLTKLFQNTYQNLKNQGVRSIPNRCFDGDATQHCFKKGKTSQWQDLTYLDPTYSKTYEGINCKEFKDHDGNKFTKNINSQGDKRYQTTLEHYPVSTHVHGLQVRPLFDGNPMSWFDNHQKDLYGDDGPQYGLGYNTAQSPYFKVFNDRRFNQLQQLLSIKQDNRKINSYPNVQQPGTLWYHDHAMGITAYNVQLGLTSFYVIRNQRAEKDLPKGRYEKLLYIYRNIDQPKLMQNCSEKCNKQDIHDLQAYKECLKTCEQDKKGIQFINHKFYRNGTYRIRILSGDFQNVYNFHIIQNNERRLNFSVIGTDSAIRRYPVHNVDQLYLAPAQRADILVNFADVSSDSVNIIIQGKISIQVEVVDGKQPNQDPVNKRINLIDVPYFHLNKTKYEKKVSVRRMRPLVWDFNGRFGINGHLNYMSGASQNPKIGSIQDWYLINNIPFGHPIHIHLIQFQILGYYELRSIKCTDSSNRTSSTGIYLMQLIYQLCYQNNLVDEDGFCYNRTINLNDAESLCLSMSSTFAGDTFDNFFKSYKVETVNHSQQSDGPKISGMDIFTKTQTSKDLKGNRIYYYNSCLEKYNQTLIKDGQFLFIDDTKTKTVTDTNLKEWQKGWKDTVWVPAFLVAHVRIRWASTDLTPQCWQDLNSKAKNNSYALTESCNNKKFFKVDQTELLEYPGFLYHCHILDHEDNEMMRPIMMQPSGLMDKEGKQIKPWSERWEQLNCQIANYELKQSKKNEFIDYDQIRRI